MISWNGIKSRAMAFAREWVDVSSEDAEAKTVWNKFFDACLVDLYDPLTMPQALLKAHQQLDKAVDAAYTVKKFFPRKPTGWRSCLIFMKNIPDNRNF